MTDTTTWGPLAHLIGAWEGNDGVDVAFSNLLGKVINTPYREKADFKPFGPVDNGRQSLYGLDYHSAMWRGDEENPFHTEVGYWLWDGASGEIMKCFVVPRGITTLAGGQSASDATTFTMSASIGDPQYGISSNKYLNDAAPTLSYDTNISILGDGLFSYTQSTILHMRVLSAEMDHSDLNTLRRVS